MTQVRSRYWVPGIVLAAVLWAGAPLAHADEPALPKTYSAGDKLGRGLANVFLGFIEVPRNIHNTTTEESLLVGWTVGLGKGVGYTVLRFLVGVYETVTFPFPLPDDFVPVYQPEYVWQAPGPRYK